MEKNLDAIWNDVTQSAKDFLPQGADVWLYSCLPISIDGGVLTINVANPFAKASIENKILIPMEEFLRSRGHAEHVAITLNDTPQEQERAKAVVQTQATNSNRNGLNPNYVFDAFVVGKSNRLAHAASLAVSESPGVAYNPLFIWGGVGLGKTHLMHAIAHHVEQNLQGARTLYVSSEQFTNDLITSIRQNTTYEFRAQYRNLDVLLVDDIQFIEEKESTQEEFFNTFNSLHGASKQIVISSDRPPRDIKGVEERLVSRFEWGLVTDIQQPDLETRVAILQKKAEQKKDEMKGYKIPEEVILFLAQNISSNIRELEGALNRIIHYSNTNAEPISPENMGIWFNDVLRNTTKGKISIDYIQQLTAESYNISVEDLISPKRTAELAEARQIAMYLCRKLLSDYSLQHIGRTFNKKDHTTVLHAYNKIGELLKTNNLKIKSVVDNIMNKLGN
ncbi:MAG: chromosomal replication initiator protein DnaA [Synergistaceae bacterium]|nr:chromosomal replication initiator protein DnaA [Synergistaceae bacterium]